MFCSGLCRGYSAGLLLAFLAVTMPAAAGTSTSSCYGVRNPDLRRDCLARTQKDRTQCTSIRDGDARRQCEAAVTSDPHRCLSIKNPDARRYCQSGAASGN